ncbi:RNA-directed DNA polymerase, eukaryota, Reverse transcriptase zinc-binding domain protein [Artemisia annua]|uniref:RNA-directed DNA polymerase, eukaryota, Reverse transcriptase zinc-binding domain protein n=1 Tax=Artemisia annua TaxID=35608 RepID=A0A2U1MRF0_ARTAN|nr:RNA-directed DNA polymerase, eukaryota, Reverse transcriptase zinc-binding domain protein [Artemisia annua]
MGLASGEVWYVGGMRVLILFKSDEQAVMARDEITGRVDKFDSIEIWGDQEYSFERIAWLRIHGVPLNLLSNKVLNDVGGLFGSIIKEANHTSDDADVSFHYVGILVDHVRVVQDEVSLTWQDKRFKVWVMEDFREWLPDFLYGRTGERNRHNTHMDAPVTAENQEDGRNKEDFVGVSDDGPEVEAFQPVNSPTARFTGEDVVLENVINGDINIDVSKIKGNVDGSFQVCGEASILEGCHNKDEILNINSSGAGVSIRGAGRSSNERPVKEQTILGDDDPFGLDPFILGQDINVLQEDDALSDGQKVFSEEEMETDGDGNASSENIAGYFQSGDAPHPAPDSNSKVFSEVIATVGLGVKLGAHLETCEPLIKETILKEEVEGKDGWVKKVKDENGISVVALQETTGERNRHNTHMDAPVTAENQEDGRNKEDFVGVSDDGPEVVAFQPVNSPTARFTGEDVVLENVINGDINIDVSKIKGNVDGSFQVCGEASILEGCHNKDEILNINSSGAGVSIRGAGRSSNERPVKEQTILGDDDPFGLDPFILGQDINVMSEGFSEEEMETDGDGNASSKNIAGYFQSGDAPQPAPDSNSKVFSEAYLNLEVIATVGLGVKLGAHLETCEPLIKETILKEEVEGKDGWVKKVKDENGISVVALQETLCRDVGTLKVASFWGRKAVEWEAVESSGRSGSLLMLWDPSVFVKGSVIKNHNFLLVSGHLKDDNTVMNILNNYAPQRVVDKISLWSSLLSIIGIHVGFWCICGDFNAIRYQEERKNSSFNHLSANDFNRFINDAGLLEWPEACFRALPRYLSDHCPIVLTVVNKNFGARPFQWFNSWLDRAGCEDMEGPGDIVLFNKFWFLRNSLREWKAKLELLKVKSSAIDVGEFKGIALSDTGLVVSHLFYVDDALILGEWSTRQEVVEMASVMGCRVGLAPFEYLGILVGANMNRVSNWRKIVDIFEARLALWKANCLSIGGESL